MTYTYIGYFKIVSKHVWLSFLLGLCLFPGPLDNYTICFFIKLILKAQIPLWPPKNNQCKRFNYRRYIVLNCPLLFSLSPKINPLTTCSLTSCCLVEGSRESRNWPPGPDPGVAQLGRFACANLAFPLTLDPVVTMAAAPPGPPLLLGGWLPLCLSHCLFVSIW